MHKRGLGEQAAMPLQWSLHQSLLMNTLLACSILVPAPPICGSSATPEFIQDLDLASDLRIEGVT